jgi:hypothetical protein
VGTLRERGDHSNLPVPVRHNRLINQTVTFLQRSILFELHHTLKLIFGFDVVHAKKRGRFVHNTKLMVLLLLTFGQFFIVGSTAFVLWLAGQYGDPPNWRWLRSLRKLRSFGR